MNWCLLLQGDAIERMRSIAADSVHCVVTSPPYYGLRDYEAEGQLGLEATPQEYVDRLVLILAEVWRVLREDGTLWLNLGDSYARNGGEGDPGLSAQVWATANGHQRRSCRLIPDGLKNGDLMGIPWRVALALQAAGWYLRSDVVWAKPNCMPESVRTRPTKCHEYVFILTKSDRYFYDHGAVLEPFTDPRDGRDDGKKPRERNRGGRMDGFTKPNGIDPLANGGRNRRTVWTIPTENFKPVKSTRHYAVMPRALAEVCILAGTSAHGVCAVCGASWRRVLDRREPIETRVKIGGYPGRRDSGVREIDPMVKGGNTLARVVIPTDSWEPGCECGAGVVPATVLDPFTGSGTTAVVALSHGRNFMGTELNPGYVELAKERVELLQLVEPVVMEVA